ncbi:TPT-domain-containing protein [Coniophora puteana RWD-64-598 SS2]|uniref:TPT-domain-containing protein n=1 Tax=Coniophora puteana (strain RWD-64-598) TaxID=741705 RepID=A0A5M3MLH6_CONPW|nr:TPT-domain-containing protein [Coniophora puteana RWD-64-598 SS2]EIW79820.1 TPT-domain-containing protein [Coniophora puteana RWD-64-598 SS2]
MALEKGELVADDETLVDSDGARSSVFDHDPTPDEKPSLPPAALPSPTSAAGLGEETPLAQFLNSEPFWLLLYFTFNLVLTLYNKIVLVKFPFPYTLTALHALCGTIGGGALLRMGFFTPAVLTDRENLALVAFSVLYTVNIAVSNISLQLVTVPFHQVVRAATPLFIILFNLILFGTGSSKMKFASLVPVIAGVGFATYGDYYATPTGLLLTLLGTVLAALKTIYTSILQSRAPTSPPDAPPSAVTTIRAWLIPPRLALHPLDLLCRMAPLAFAQCVILAQLSGELGRVHEWSSAEMDMERAAGLLFNGAIAFGLNIVSFTANRKVGPLSITVAANVKQVLSVFLAVAIFDLVISPTNGFGIFLTLGGGAWYAVVDFREKRRRRAGAGAR